MKRSHVLLLGAGLIFVVAVGLRVRSQLTSPDYPRPTSMPAARSAIDLPQPHDYVAHPIVASEEVNRGPARIISLAPSITEILCALGLRDHLIGRTPYCHYPPDIERVEAVGAMVDTNLERIRALNPDLILTTTNSGQVITHLQQLGLRYEGIPHNSLEEVYGAIERIGTLCDRPQTAHNLAKAIRSEIDSIHQSVLKHPMPRRRVLVSLGELPIPPAAVWVAGPGLFLDALLQLTGHDNAATGIVKHSQEEIALPKLLVIDPDIILVFSEHDSPDRMVDMYQSWSELGSLRAIRDQRVRSIGTLTWLSAGPRVAIELHRFVTVLSECAGREPPSSSPEK